MIRRPAVLAPLALALTLGLPGLAEAKPSLPKFEAADFSTSKANPYLPLKSGAERRFVGVNRRTGQQESFVLRMVGPGPTILGVATTTQLDEAYVGKWLVERTLDYFAADAEGNVWYFGEDVVNYRYDKTGKLIGKDNHSAWRAGVNGAKPGITMPAATSPGLSLFQEHAPANGAMDWFEIVARDLSVKGPAGTFTGVLKVYESSTVEPGLREFKYYAPGVGLIRADEELSRRLDSPAIVVELQR
ncbi:hypothetical protein R5H32_12735 [Defluviimonas sp. D31]|uniref:hypothetical protein n=1 Tax=Defluviimonas sp. D31 TaxID=3083253 RepID=UPI0029700587|nr:hypothetical protein [Defluviimonas sp. D31]MDW4550222.1 hypothetical protein [Defluviimonas sp. D31]